MYLKLSVVIFTVLLPLILQILADQKGQRIWEYSNSMDYELSQSTKAPQPQLILENSDAQVSIQSL